MSLVDLLPTFIEIGGGDAAMIGVRVDGRSLMPPARGEADPVDEAIGENCAEMTGYPVIMIRRGLWTYIHCDSDLAQLYDLSVDPLETTNLAEDARHNNVSAGFAAEVAARWDGAALRQKIIATQ